MDEKGQGAMEILLMIALAVTVAVVVGLYLKSIPPQIQNEIQQRSPAEP